MSGLPMSLWQGIPDAGNRAGVDRVFLHQRAQVG